MARKPLCYGQGGGDLGGGQLHRFANGQFVCTGVLVNHESPLFPHRLVPRKIVAAACCIAGGSDQRQVLGDTSVRRDGGRALEYMEAIHRKLQQDTPEDFVIATGRQHSLMDFFAMAFEELGLDVREPRDHDAALARPLEITANRGDPGRAVRMLGWQAQVHLRDVVRRIIAHGRGPGAPTVG